MISKQQFESLQPKEKTVFTYIIAHKEMAGYMNVRELANACNVSSATVLRCIHKMGFDSYPAFKYWCHHKEEHTCFSFHKQRIMSYLQTMDNELYSERLEEAASILCECTFVLFIGIGNSAGIASYGARCFSNKGMFSLCMDDPFYNFSRMPDKMGVVICSVSGETPEIIRRLDTFIEANIPIISITRSYENTIAKLSDLTLAYAVEFQRNKDSFDMSSQIPTVLLIEELAHMIYEKRKTM